MQTENPLKSALLLHIGETGLKRLENHLTLSVLYKKCKNTLEYFVAWCSEFNFQYQSILLVVRYDKMWGQ